jgi:hypothetical protein
MQGLFIVRFLLSIRKQACWELTNETEGLHMKWYLIWSLLHWNEKTTIQMNGWFNTRCDLAAWDGEDRRKGFEVLSKGEGQTMAWRLKNLAKVKKKVISFSWGTNQTIMVTLKWRIKFIGWIVGSDLIHLKLFLINWMESSHMLKMDVLKEKIKVDMLTPSLDDDWELWHLVWRKSTQAIQTLLLFDLDLIGMLYY